MTRTADARTNSIGHSVVGADSPYGFMNHDTFAAWDIKQEQRTQKSDELLSRTEYTLWRALDSKNLPTDASVVAGRLIQDGAHPLEIVEIWIYQKYIMKKGERVSTRGRRSVFYYKGQRYQSINGSIFVGDGGVDRVYGKTQR